LTARSLLLAITGLALILRFWSFGNVPSDPFYDAAVRSMGLSWHNFLLGAFDPRAALSIDKPPIDLWLEVLATKLFVFSSASVRLPEAIAGTIAVPLLYGLVRRGYGLAAGLGAAAALAVLPAAVMTGRSDTMDTLCATVLIGAMYAVVSLPPARGVLVAAGLAGLAFEIKLFQALVVLPALVVLAWRVLDDPRRSLHRAGLMFVVVATAWPVAASLVPGPWPLGSTDGEVWNVILVYNGLDRLGAATGPTAPIGPSPWRLFTASYFDLIGFYLLVVLSLALAAARGRLSCNPLVVAITVGRMRLHAVQRPGLAAHPLL
jgi:4-amino-4-deoxy-L-arabinose transferase-like glycosyltransferase